MSPLSPPSPHSPSSPHNPTSPRSPRSPRRFAAAFAPDGDNPDDLLDFVTAQALIVAQPGAHEKIDDDAAQILEFVKKLFRGVNQGSEYYLDILTSLFKAGQTLRADKDFDTPSFELVKAFFLFVGCVTEADQLFDEALEWMKKSLKADWRSVKNYIDACEQLYFSNEELAVIVLKITSEKDKLKTLEQNKELINKTKKAKSIADTLLESTTSKAEPPIINVKKLEPVVEIEDTQKEKIQKEFSSLPIVIPPFDPAKATHEHRIHFHTALARAKPGFINNPYPLEHSLVKFDDAPEFFYDANFLFDKTALLARSPTNDDEVSQFLWMALKTNVTTIIKLNNDESTNYFLPGKYGDITVSCLKSCAYTSKEGELFLEKRLLLIEHPKLKPTRIVHYFFPCWPDMGTPKPIYASTLFSIVLEEHRTGTLLAHCFAALGRAVTFMMIWGAAKANAAGDKSPNVYYQSASKVRRARNTQIQTVDQYGFGYKVLKMLEKNDVLKPPKKKPSPAKQTDHKKEAEKKAGSGSHAGSGSLN